MEGEPSVQENKENSDSLEPVIDLGLETHKSEISDYFKLISEGIEESSSTTYLV